MRAVLRAANDRQSSMNLDLKYPGARDPRFPSVEFLLPVAHDRPHRPAMSGRRDSNLITAQYGSAPSNLPITAGEARESPMRHPSAIMLNFWLTSAGWSDHRQRPTRSHGDVCNHLAPGI